VVGIVRGRDVLAARASGRPFDLKSIMTLPLFVPESLHALTLLESFKQAGQHVALVIDEHGGLQGMVTAHDILEAIVGDLPVSGETTERQAAQREDGTWLLDGLLLIDVFKEIFDFDPLPDEDHIGYQTLGGFVLAQFGDIPTPGAGFDFRGYRFEVASMDGRRVEKVTAAPLEARRKATPEP
jgi:putative hemolysin